MSSWLDTKKYMTSLAKTAMAEAQKTLDKALEIQEEENEASNSVETVIDTEFSQWGMSSEISFTKSQSEPVSLQPKSPKENELLLKAVDDNLGPNSSALMQESMTEEILEERDELNSSMSSSRTTVVSSNPSNKSTEDQESKVITIAEEKTSEASSSSKSYEMLKLESCPTSGHTSDNEVEVITNFSSDIEIISSPVLSENGHRKLQNQQLIQSKITSSPSNKKIKGHLRTESDQSDTSGSSQEIEKLLKKIAEMSEILEARETKLVELSKSNLEYQEKNTDLTSQVKEAMKINAKLSEANLSSEEFTLRLSKMEKKIQHEKQEKEKCQEEIKNLRSKVFQFSESDIQEKDEIINDLRSEGEALSKQAGKHCEVIKKLRTKEKSNEKEIKHLKEKLDEKIKENDRLSKSLEAKNDIESKQIEAIQNLTEANQKWEQNDDKLASELEDAHEKSSGLKLSLESAKKEIVELKQKVSDKENQEQEFLIQQESQEKLKLQKEIFEKSTEFAEEKSRLLKQIDELKESVLNCERINARTEEKMKREREDLLFKLQESETRFESLNSSMSASTRPLLRQIEALQASLSEIQNNSERAEKSLTDRLNSNSVQLAAAQERERTAAEQYRQISSKGATLEAKLTHLNKINCELETQIKALKTESVENQSQLSQVKSGFELKGMEYAKELEDLKRQLEVLKRDNHAFREETDSEKRKNVALLDQLKDRDRRLKEMSNDLDNMKSSPMSYRAKSKSPSLASVNSEQWPDEVFESRGIQNDGLRMLIGASGSSSALLESLQSQLKQREVRHLQVQNFS